MSTTRTLKKYWPLLISGFILLVIILMYGRSIVLIEKQKRLSGEYKSSSRSLLKKNNIMDVTLVTAFFNIGPFPKGYSTNILTPDLYQQWMNIFSKISNPVVAYFDDDKFATFFHQLRNSSLLKDRTKIVKVDRNDLWAFSLLPNITRIYSDPKYPQFLPNTVVPEYSCVMHAKYELMLKTIEDNPFSTDYFAWIDIGLFREENISKVDMFHISLPPKFNQSQIAYSEVEPRVILAPPAAIFRANGVWVCGCFFIGLKHQMKLWIQYYMNYVGISLSKGLMNTDQQVLYAMVNDKNFHINVSVQTYKPGENGKFNKWFHLGYLCKVEDKAE